MNNYRPYSTYNYNARVSAFARVNNGPIDGTVATAPAACCGKPVRACACSKR